MQALIYNGPGKNNLEDRSKPVVQTPTDAVVRVTKTTICGNDLHIPKGDVPTCVPGTVLGHEGVGVIDSVGAGVTTFKPGDRVLISCISACSHCEDCRKGMSSHCTTGGWILGNRIDGTQAEFVRIPHADTSLNLIPAGADEEALVMLSDILPIGFGCGVLNGKVQVGGSVAIVGSGLPMRAGVVHQRALWLCDSQHLGDGHRLAATDVVSAGHRPLQRGLAAGIQDHRQVYHQQVHLCQKRHFAPAPLV